MVPKEFFVPLNRLGSGLPRDLIPQQELDQESFRRRNERAFRMFLDDLPKEARLATFFLRPAFLPSESVNPRRLAFLTRPVSATVVRIPQSVLGSVSRSPFAPLRLKE